MLSNSDELKIFFNTCFLKKMLTKPSINEPSVVDWYFTDGECAKSDGCPSALYTCRDCSWYLRKKPKTKKK